MPGKISIELEHVQETLLLPLWGRAIETRKLKPMLRDNVAVEIIDKISYDFSTIAGNINEITRHAWIARSLHFDRAIQKFLQTHPRGTVVNIGCGLDTTFDRIDNGTLMWYDLDLPDVISLRKKFIPEQGRRRCIACSVFDESWRDEIVINDGVFFFAAGVLYYFDEAQIKNLFAVLASSFPDSEIVFDGASPLGVRVSNEKVLKAGGMDKDSGLKWGIDNLKSIQSWDPRFHLLEAYPLYKGMKKGLPMKVKWGTFLSDRLRIMFMVHLKFSAR
jgi:O-methyltransferase involved in polyketide biosynthesis